MKNKLKTIVITLITLCSFGFSLTPLTTYAAGGTDICSMKNVSQAVRDASGCTNRAKTVPDVVVNILNIVIGLSGLIAVIFIIIGGLGYMTSSGETAKIEKAKKTILYAVIGLIVCALAFAIVNFAVTTINNSQ